MIENNHTEEEELPLTDEELMSRHVIADDHELHFLDSYLTDTLRKRDDL